MLRPVHRLAATLACAFLLLPAGSGFRASAASERLEIEAAIKQAVFQSRNFKATVHRVEPLLARYRTLGQTGEREIDGIEARYQRWKWYWQDRVMPDGSYPDLNAIYGPLMQARSGLRRSTAGSLPQVDWVNVTQTSAVGGYDGMGRTTDIAFHPTDPDIFFVSAPRGGVWKTVDGGASYAPISDSLPFVSVSNLAVDPSAPDTIYAVLGDHVWYGPQSAGIYKTTDGGASWNPTSLTFDYTAAIRVYDLLIDPAAPGTLLAATSAGVYRTTDGFASHTQVFNTDTRDLEYRPGSSSTVYLAAYGFAASDVWKSEDGGATWTKKSNINPFLPAELSIATTAADPDMLAINSGGQFYMSGDSGESYTGGVAIGSGGPIMISQTDADRIYSGFVSIFRSIDGGGTWAQATNWYFDGVFPEVHADQRNVATNPLKPDSIYWCNDGGIYELDEAAGTWTEWSDGLIIMQYYRIANSQSNPTVLIGGTQDNGGRIRRGSGNWGSTNGGDGMEVAIDPTDERVIYTTYINGQIYRSLDGWLNDTYDDISANIPGSPSGEWITPYEISPADNRTLVAAYDRVWRTTDRGESWTAVSGELAGGDNLDHLAIAPGDESTMYVAETGSTGDAYGTGTVARLYRTTSLGGSWDQVQTPTTTNRVSGLDVSHEDSTVLYATAGGHLAGDKVFVSVDGGDSWKNISGGLPNVAFADVRTAPDSSNGVYVAGDAGVFYRDDSMVDWEEYGASLPMISVVDIDFQESAGLIRIGTHGRGIYEAPLHRLPASDYCAPQHTAGSFGSIIELWLDGLLFASGAPTSVVVEGYSNFSNQEATLVEGQSYDLQVVADQSHADSRVTAWIDWNLDGSFDAGELVLDATGAGPWSVPVTLPAGFVEGDATLRVRLQRGSVSPDPCAAAGLAGGETEDYRVQLLADGDLDGTPDVSDCAPGVNSVSDPAGDVGSTLSFPDAETLAWQRTPDTNVYNVYGGTRSAGSEFVLNHTCLEPEVPATSLVLSGTPAAGDLEYFLVAATNRCAPGEGPLGLSSSGDPRAGGTCPSPGNDGDSDGVLDIDDNCPAAANADQADADLDGIGDACE
ncbi:hypothetical protein ABI59_19885 [Acidobacteria bacterium Mor1]|nr:hypothetical protein ABI59_19885 [Acidobacteria bacterium Mor1]